MYNDYCKCEHSSRISSDIESSDLGYWDICCDCGKRIEDGFHYYNNSESEYYDDVDLI